MFKRGAWLFVVPTEKRSCTVECKKWRIVLPDSVIFYLQKISHYRCILVWLFLLVSTEKRIRAL